MAYLVAEKSSLSYFNCLFPWVNTLFISSLPWSDPRIRPGSVDPWIWAILAWIS